MCPVLSKSQHHHGQAYPRHFTKMPLSQRFAALALVFAVHMLALMLWLIQPDREMQPHQPAPLYVTLQTEMARPQAEQPLLHHQHQPSGKVAPRPQPQVQDVPVIPLPPIPVSLTSDVGMPTKVTPVTMTSTMSSASQSALNETAPAAESPPNYQAAYLKNSPPEYPNVARRMGWQGKVTLDVEVLVNGTTGTIKILHGSGYPVLDKAAVNAVKNWYFVPALRAGKNSVENVLVPVNFRLQDN